MASATVARAKHATLSGTTVDTVILTGWTDAVEVINHSSTERLTVVHGVGATPDDPTASQDDSLVIPAGGTAEFDVERGSHQTGSTVRVKLLGNGNAYSVSRIDRHTGYHGGL